MNLSELKSFIEIEKKKARLILCEQSIPREKTKALIKDFWEQFKFAVENPGDAVNSLMKKPGERFDPGAQLSRLTFKDAMKNKEIWMSKPVVVEAGTDVHPTLEKVRISLIPMEGSRAIGSSGGAHWVRGMAIASGTGPGDIWIPKVEKKYKRGVMDLKIYYNPEKIKRPEDFRNYYNVIYRNIQEVVSHETVHFGQFAGRDSGWKKTKFQDLAPAQQKVIKDYVSLARAKEHLEKMQRARRTGRALTSDDAAAVHKLYPDPEKWKVMEKEDWKNFPDRSKIQMYLMDPGEVDAHVRGYNYLAQRSKGRLTLEKMIDDRINAYRCSGIAKLIPGRLTWWDCLNNRQAKDVKKKWMEHASKYIPCSRRKDGTFINPKGCGAKGTGKKKQKTKHTNKQKKRALKLRKGIIQSADYVKERSKVGDTKAEKANLERTFRKIGVGLNVLGGGLFAKQVYDIVFHEKMSYKQQMDALEDIAYDIAKEVAITTAICVTSGGLCVLYGVYAIGEMINSFLPSFSSVSSFFEDFLASLFDERSWTTTPEEEAEFEREDQLIDSSSYKAQDEAECADRESNGEPVYWDGNFCIDDSGPTDD